MLRENVHGNSVEHVVSVGRLLWGSGCGVERVDDWEGEEEREVAEGEGKEGIGVDRINNYEGKEHDKEGKHQEKGYIIPDLVLAADVVSSHSLPTPPHPTPPPLSYSPLFPF